ncbi:SOS response-associated peptidase family protein [Defluviimonas nitratireducens]|nr:SOS response-associated peptidase family protein [Defluviimonas nitratireducens]MDF1621743.1 SOS response-associated peptidase family protein [Defluviimonas nitratireducens]
MPSPPGVLRTARDPGVTNVRNLASPHWRRWLGPEHRCLVPVTAFAEPIKGGNQSFRAADSSAAMFFAGIETRGWRSVRKVKDGETEDNLFACLTCPPNAEVQPIHPMAVPVILTTSDAQWCVRPGFVQAHRRLGLYQRGRLPMPKRGFSRAVGDEKPLSSLLFLPWIAARRETGHFYRMHLPPRHAAFAAEAENRHARG